MSLLSELRRRNVIRVAIAYAIVAWLLIEVVATTFPILSLPDWTVTLVTALLLIGFPLALIFAWAFELTPHGIKLEKEVSGSESITFLTGRKLDFTIIGLLVIALIYVMVDGYVLRDEATSSESAPIESAARHLEKSIAVLPFANRSANEDDAFFTDGFHDDLLTHISRIGAIKTISRTSVMQYRNTTKTMPQIAEELGVATILEGGVQRSGDAIRINVQLIDAADDTHLWAQIYDRQLTAANIFAIQSEIAKAIAEELRATLSVDDQQRSSKVPTDSLPALEAYFLGKQKMATRLTDELAAAADLLQRAIELDPGFALAYVALADTYSMQSAYSGLPADKMRAKSERAIDRAMELDDRLGEAHASLGFMKTVIDPVAAEAALQRALELNPNYASAHQWYSTLLARIGRLREALEHANAAIELDPRSAIIRFRRASIYADLGMLDEGMAELRSIIADDPSFSRAYEGIGSIYRNTYGQLAEAARWYRKRVASDPGTSARADVAEIYLDLGDVEQAEHWIEQSRKLPHHDDETKVAVHLLQIYRGNEEQAVISAQQLLAENPRHCCNDRVAAAYLRDRDVQAGRFAEARARYEEIYPELLAANGPTVDAGNYRAAIDLALLLVATGEHVRANNLLYRTQSVVESLPRLGYSGTWIADAQILALRGESKEALAALREAIDAGWRRLWWYYLMHDMSLEAIRAEPEFRAMVKEIEADMAEQLARLREWESAGDLAPNLQPLE